MASLSKAQGLLVDLAESLAPADFAELAGWLARLLAETRQKGPRPLWEASVAKPQVQQERRDAALCPAQELEGLALEEREGMGRVLVATRAVEKGEALFSERPALVVPGCAGKGKQGAIMAELAARGAHRGVTLDMDALCAFFKSCAEQDLEKLAGLQTHSDSADYVAGALAEQVADVAVSVGALEESRRSAFLRFLQVVCVNAHSLPHVSGIMLCGWLSMLSHSCSPNATYTTNDHSEDVTATVRAVHPIQVGEVISMSYLPLQLLLASTAVRQEALRVQKGFLCACERCVGPDEVRVLPCGGGSCVSEPGGEAGQVRWCCLASKAPAEPDATALEKEEKLVPFVLSFDHESDEQTINSIISVVDQDLGSEGSSEHFLKAWLLLDLLEALLSRATDEKDSASRAAAVLWRLRAWVQGRLPNCMHILALQAAAPVAAALLAAGRREEAREVAEAFRAPLEAAAGPKAKVVQRFRELTEAVRPKEEGW